MPESTLSRNIDELKRLLSVSKERPWTQKTRRPTEPVFRAEQVTDKLAPARQAARDTCTSVAQAMERLKAQCSRGGHVVTVESDRMAEIIALAESYRDSSVVCLSALMEIREVLAQCPDKQTASEAMKIINGLESELEQ